MPVPNQNRNNITASVVTNQIKAFAKSQGPVGPQGPQGPAGSPGSTDFDDLTNKPEAPAFTGLLVNNSSGPAFPTDQAEYSIQPDPMTFAYRDTDGTLKAAPAVDNDDLVQKIQLDMIEEELYTDIQTGDATTLASANSYTDTQVSSVTKNSIGLGNVDNTSDLNKPISTSTQIALDGKRDLVSGNSQVYTTDASGNQNSVTYSNGTAANTIAQRMAGGFLQGPTPTLPSHYTRKDYVDTADALKANVTDLANYVLKAGDTMNLTSNLTLIQSSNSATGALAIGNTTSQTFGRIWVGTGTGATFNIQNGGTSSAPIQLNPGGTGNIILGGGGLVGIGTASPTHTLTLPSTATGIALYNTVDQTTNYERYRQMWSANIHYYTGEFSGTGVSRNLRMGPFALSGNGYISLNASATGIGFVQSVGSSAFADVRIHHVSGTLSTAAGVQYGVSIAPTIGQSSTAGYTALLINPTETSTGSGAKNLIDAQVGGVSMFKVDNAGNTTPTTATFTPLATPAYAPGLLYFDTAEDALTFYSNDPNVMMNIGQEQFIRVTNNTGSTIANGVPVYINGQASGIPTVAVAGNASNTTSQVIGLATESLANGATGYVAIQGKVRNFNTSAFTAGATLYLGASGALTTTAPTNLATAATIGTVLVSNATTGVVMVSVSRPANFTAQGATVDLGTVLSNQGFRTAGTAYPITTSGAVALSGSFATSGSVREAPASQTATVSLSVASPKNQRITATGSTAINITLPATTTAGYVFRFYRTDANAAVVTILGTINGNAGGYVLASQYKYVEVMSTTVSGTWEVWGNN